MREKTLLDIRDEIRQMFAWKEDIITLEHEQIIATYVLAYMIKQANDMVKELKI